LREILVGINQKARQRPGFVESGLLHSYNNMKSPSGGIMPEVPERKYMPWSNQSGSGGPWGGGGNNGGGSGGPWGQGPRGPQGPRNTPPDLEDIIRKGQDRLKTVLPGGGGLSPALLGLLGIGLVGLWGLQTIYTIQPDELGVELRFGKPKEDVSAPGLHFHWWPIETVEKAKVSESLIRIGGQDQSPSSALMLSGDQNIVNVVFSVAFQVADPRAYLFNVADPDAMVQQVAESAMREIVGRRKAQDVFRDDRQGIAQQVRDTTQQTLDSYGAGVTINAISIEDASPPREVANAFDEVQRAEQDEDKFVEEANRYSNEKLGTARGEAAQIREDAAAYKNRVVQEAQGEAQRFVSVYEEYAKAPDVTRQRLFLETMENVLKGSNKVIVEQGSGQGVVPYLPLPELQQRRSGSTAPAAGAQAGGNN
jgi:membrane protease subunit HflK